MFPIIKNVPGFMQDDKHNRYLTDKELATPSNVRSPANLMSPLPCQTTNPRSSLLPGPIRVDTWLSDFSISALSLNRYLTSPTLMLLNYCSRHLFLLLQYKDMTADVQALQRYINQW